MSISSPYARAWFIVTTVIIARLVSSGGLRSKAEHPFQNDFTIFQKKDHRGDQVMPIAKKVEERVLTRGRSGLPVRKRPPEPAMSGHAHQSAPALSSWTQCNQTRDTPIDLHGFNHGGCLSNQTTQLAPNKAHADNERPPTEQPVATRLSNCSFLTINRSATPHEIRKIQRHARRA